MVLVATLMAFFSWGIRKVFVIISFIDTYLAIYVPFDKFSLWKAVKFLFQLRLRQMTNINFLFFAIGILSVGDLL